MSNVPESAADVAAAIGIDFDSAAVNAMGDESEKQRTFCARLAKIFRSFIRQQYLDCANQLVNQLNTLGHELVLDSLNDEVSFCVRYSRAPGNAGEPQAGDFVVCFDLDTAVLFTEDKFHPKSAGDAFDDVLTEVDQGKTRGLNGFGRPQLEASRADLPTLQQRCETLQSILEYHTCKCLRSKVALFVEGLNLLGHEFSYLNSSPLEINYRDHSSMLHVGITCIATVICESEHGDGNKDT